MSASICISWCNIKLEKDVPGGIKGLISSSCKGIYI